MFGSRKIFILLMILLISAVSCKPSGSATPTAQNTESMPTSPALPTNASTNQPTGTTVAQPTIAPTAPVEKTTVATTNPESYVTNGVATYQSNSGSVKYFDLSGNLLGELPTASMSVPQFTRAIIAGAFSNASTLPPVVYYVPSGELWLSEKDRNEKLMDAPNLLHLYGAPGEQFFAFTLAQYTDSSLRSLLYLGDIQSLPSAQPVIDYTSTESYALKPLAISFSNGQPAGVWYTEVPNGIGGDIVFEPRRSLNYYDLATNETKTVLDKITNPVGISPDQTWVAYQYAEGISPISIAHNFDFSTAITLPLRDDSDRGAGEAFFSPDNQYVAWREAGGSLSGTPVPLHQIIRIAKLDGSLLAEIPLTTLQTNSGVSAITWITPIGWLDAQTLAVQVWTSAEEQAVLSVKFDGSQISVLATGAFIGFLFP